MRELPTLALVSGFWGQNIGNAFFNVGGKHLLEAAAPDARVNFIQDQPGYRTFHNQAKGNPGNDLNLLQHLKTDAIVLQGPLFTETFRSLWEPTFKALKARGTKIVLMSSAFFRHNDAEIKATREFLSEYPPDILTTRDQETYDELHDLCPRSYSQIDSAFFVPFAYDPFDLACDPYVAVNFDRYPEPRIWGAGRQPRGPGAKTFEALGAEWNVEFPRLPYRFSEASKLKGYMGAVLDRKKRTDHVNGYQVVRTEHRVNPHITWKVYRRPNMVASDEPWTYFNVYANSKLTISDRVHACVMTLAYGNPATLTTSSPRSRLFDRAGVGGIHSEAVTLPDGRLKQEYDGARSFMRKALGEVLE